MRKRGWWITLMIVLLLPAGLRWWANASVRTGLLPYFIYQLYYLPFGSWLKPPFFNHDSELGILVLPAGAFLTATVYTLLMVLLNKATMTFLQRNNTNPKKTPPQPPPAQLPH
jgi:hypothetical protein